MLQSLKDIQHAFYINCDHRIDRKQQVEAELEAIGINATRFNAIKTNNGRIGCTLSHLKLLEMAIENDWSHLLILEDDIQFLNPTLFKIQFSEFLSLHDDWDVVLFAGNNIPPYFPIDNTCVKVTRCQTTTGYLVNGNYLKTLHDNIKEGLNKLMKNPQMHFYFAIDKYWFYLQQLNNWYLIIPLSVVQRESYSDIEKKNTNYGHLMIDIDKSFLNLPNATLV